MTVVAIHQPNYAPWLGYFAKIAQADILVFLDDAQYSKNSYINRVQIDAGGEPRWLTIPVSYAFGDPISSVRIADAQWRRAHADRLTASYRGAPAFAEVFALLSQTYSALPHGSLAAVNEALIEQLAGMLGLSCRFLRSSALPIESCTGDDRLIAILRAVGAKTYVSGKGGATYQDPAKFTHAGIELRYTNFVHPVYAQGREPFLPGLSVLDALFHLGFKQSAALLNEVPVRA